MSKYYQVYLTKNLGGITHYQSDSAGTGKVSSDCSTELKTPVSRYLSPYYARKLENKLNAGVGIKPIVN